MRNEAMERSLYLLAAWFAIHDDGGGNSRIRIFSELISYMAVAVGLIVYHRLEAPRQEGSG
jgi:hypothetical protein